MTAPKRVTLSVVGLGKLGLCLAAVLASRGYEVLGVDSDRAKVDSVNKGASPIFEPGLQTLISRNRKRLSASTDFGPAVQESAATFVVVPTPSDDTGGFSLKFVSSAMEEVGRALNRKKGYHLVVLTSTVMPGSMDRSVRPTLEVASGKSCPRDFGLCYNPEFIALGDVIKGLLSPDFILVGESDRKAGSLLASIQRKVCMNSPSIERMSFYNAELAKIAVNSFVTTKMSFANTLAELCEKMPGGNVDVITSAIGRDRRIGTAYLKGALGYGGPCFPRDNVAFARYAESVGAQARIAQATHTVNMGQAERVVGLMVEKGLRSGMKAGVLGLSYKPGTNIVEQSQALMIARRLRELGHEVNVFDPAAMQAAEATLGDGVHYSRSGAECVTDSDFVVVGTPWPEFRGIPARTFKGKYVFDCWRFLGEGVRKASAYFSVGWGTA